MTDDLRITPELTQGIMSRKKFFEVALICFCVIYIALFCWLGRYARPQADDYDWYFRSQCGSFMPLQIEWYLGADGRVARAALMTLLCACPPEVGYKFLPLLMIVLYAGAVTFLVQTLIPNLSRRAKWLGILLLTSTTLAFVSSLNETLYWLNGLAYFWAGTFLMLTLALAVRALRGSSLAFVLCLVMCLVNGTTIEPSCVFQGGMAFFAALCFLWHRDKRRAMICASLWFASISAFLIMYLAPSTALRMGNYASVPFFPRLARTLLVAISFGGVTALKFCIKPLTWIFLLFLPSIHEKIFTHKVCTLETNTPPQYIYLSLRGWQIFVVTVLIAPLMQAINGWALGGGQPDRGESLTLWIMGFSWGILWTFCHSIQDCGNTSWRSMRWTKNFFAWRWTLLLIALLLNFNFTNLTYELVTGSAERFANEYDMRDTITVQQREVGVRDVIIPMLTLNPNLLFFEDLDLVSEFNGSYSNYWGVDSVRALPAMLYENPEALSRCLNGDIGDLIHLAETDKVAALALARLYDWLFPNFQGIEKDNTKAILWYSKAAKLGHREAARMPIHLYSRNVSLPNRYLQTIYWIFRSHFPLSLS